jgi:hypothetical protein
MQRNKPGVNCTVARSTNSAPNSAALRLNLSIVLDVVNAPSSATAASRRGVHGALRRSESHPKCWFPNGSRRCAEPYRCSRSAKSRARGSPCNHRSAMQPHTGLPSFDGIPLHPVPANNIQTAIEQGFRVLCPDLLPHNPADRHATPMSQRIRQSSKQGGLSRRTVSSVEWSNR